MPFGVGGGGVTSKRKQSLRGRLNVCVKSPRSFRGGAFGIQGLSQGGNLDLKIINARLQTLHDTVVQLFWMH